MTSQDKFSHEHELENNFALLWRCASKKENSYFKQFLHLFLSVLQRSNSTESSKVVNFKSSEKYNAYNEIKIKELEFLIYLYLKPF